mgnify:CR=1 FL=1
MSHQKTVAAGERARAKKRRALNRSLSPFELKQAAYGLWIAIFVSAGLPAEYLDGKGHPCVMCGGCDRFAAWNDVAERGAVHCRNCFTKGAIPKPGDGIATLQWLLKCDFRSACQWLANWLEPPWWLRLETSLGLPASALVSLRVGWSADDKATTWPMMDHDGNVVGIRLRCMKTGRKWSVKGGTSGVFLPVGLPKETKRLFIAEGPTDTAAMLSIGFNCIGRPSCNGAVRTTAKLVEQMRPNECVIVADNDSHRAGERGAKSLATALIVVCPRVRIIFPPTGLNDARDWVASGATANDVLSLVQSVGVQSLSLAQGGDQ